MPQRKMDALLFCSGGVIERYLTNAIETLENNYGSVKEYLFEDYQAESLQCSMKQTTYCANMIGSVIVNLFTNFIANQLKPLIDRDVPFKTYYDASMMYFKTEE